MLLVASFGMPVSVYAEDGFKPVFNGKNLKGWDGDEKLWSVDDGAILGSTHGNKIKKNTFLSTKKSYGDFVLRVKTKLENGNSGIQFRSEQRDNYVVAGYQADLAEKTYFGMLYEEQKRGIMPYWKALSPEEQAAIHATGKQGDWNQFEVTCKGDHIKIVLNGKTTLDFKDPEGAKEGIIALQLHVGPDMRVWFKDIEIKELK
jgi:hypothetical protein